MQPNNTKAVIYYKDIVCLDEQEEYLKRIYLRSEYKNKIIMLSGKYYYKASEIHLYNIKNISLNDY